MIAAAWVCLFSPLAAAVLITLGGTRLSRKARGYLATLSVAVSFVAACISFFSILGEPTDDRSHLSTVMDVAGGRRLRRRPVHPRRPALDLHDADRLRRRRTDRRLLDRLHGRRGRGAPLLRLHGAVRLLDAAPRPGRQPAAAPRRLGPRRAQLVPADRLPPRAAAGRGRREEGVHHERVRRRDDGARLLPAHPAHRLSDLRLVVRVGRRRDGNLGRQPRRARAARRGGREVGAAPAPDLAPRRDGGPDAGQRADPRGHDGHRGRLPARAHCADLRGRAAHPGPCRRPRRGDAPARRADRARPGRHQARHRLLDDVADRLHVPRRGSSARTRTRCST